MNDSEHNILDYMPDDTPYYMAPAWVSALRFALASNRIVEQYMEETGDIYPRAKKTPIDALIDDATGRTWKSLVSFVEWFNKAYWGDMK